MGQGGLIPQTAVNIRPYNRPGYKGEQYLLGAGTVELSHWTPNALSFDTDAPSPTVLVVNQNYDPSWRVVEGRGVATSKDGLIAVKVAAGKQHLLLAYRSQPFLIGLGITLTTFAAMLLLWLFERSRARLIRVSKAGRFEKNERLPRNSAEREGRPHLLS